jgi:hypothetical protein
MFETENPPRNVNLLPSLGLLLYSLLPPVPQSNAKISLVLGKGVREARKCLCGPLELSQDSPLQGVLGLLLGVTYTFRKRKHFGKYQPSPYSRSSVGPCCLQYLKCGWP